MLTRHGIKIVFFLAPIIVLIGALVFIKPLLSETRGGWEKYKHNPVLGGSLGTTFDVSILKEGDTYRMWFSWRHRKSIALVESSDGVNWSDPVIVLPPDPSTGWENRVNRPVVLKRANRYDMWYTGQRDTYSFIGHAISNDGRIWKRTSKDPVLSPELPWEKVAVMCPHVIYDEEEQLYKMWYSGGEQLEPDSIGYATSEDGQNWTKFPHNPVFYPGRGKAWDSHKVTGSYVLKHNGWYVMFYIGFEDPFTGRIGIARSKDGISNWERHRDNPIIRPAHLFGWDKSAVYKPSVLLEGNKWLLWYNGRKEQIEQIGFAFYEGKDLGF